jgi:hypothetical protein
MSLQLLVLAAAIAGAVWAYSRWRQGLKAAMVLLVVEGAIRKWLLPDAQELVYFGKDILLVGVYLGFLNDPIRRRLPIKVPPVLQAALLAGVSIGALQVVNPALPNLLVGLLGFKSYFLYVPLLWVVPAAFSTDRELAVFLRSYVLLAIPVGLLATAQFLSPADNPLNTYARAGAQGGYAVSFGTSPQVRVTGTFSYITGYSSYVLTVTILALAILAATRWRYRGNLRVFAALGLTLLGMLMTGSRGPVFMLVLLLPLYWWLGMVREREGISVIGRFLLAASVLAVLLNYVGSDAIGAFYGRATGGGDITGRLTGPFIEPVGLAGDAGLLGFGIGATHQAAEAVTKGILPYSWLHGLLVENEPGRVMLELGVVGFVVVYLARIYLILLALRGVFTLKTSFHRAIATSCVLFFLAHLPGGVVFNVTAGVYYWFFAGLLFLAVRLDAIRPAEQPVPVRAPPPRASRPLALPDPRPAGSAAPRWSWPPPPP